MNNEVLFFFFWFFQGSAPIVILFPIYWPCKWAHHTVTLCESIAACEHWRLYLEIQFLTQMRGPKGLCTKWTKLFSFPNGHRGQAITGTAKEGCYFLKNQIKKEQKKRNVQRKGKSWVVLSLQRDPWRRVCSSLVYMISPPGPTGWENMGDKLCTHSLPQCRLSLKAQSGIV